MNISISSSSVHLNLIRQKTGMTRSWIDNCIITRPNWKHVKSHNIFGYPSLSLMESHLKLSKIPRLHWMIQDASQEDIPQLLYRIVIVAY